VGAAGGPTIISQVVLALVYQLDLGWDAARAIAAPRIHHQWRPDELRVERSLDQKTAAGLETLGHRLNVARTIGVAQAVAAGAEGRLTGVADPRVGGKAMRTPRLPRTTPRSSKRSSRANRAGRSRCACWPPRSC
jgi:gamma-glutamyltranspeptidase/glutathione hydrolase